MKKRILSGSFSDIQKNMGQNSQNVLFRKGDELIVKGLDLVGGEMSVDAEKDELVFRFQMRKGDILCIGDTFDG